MMRWLGVRDDERPLVAWLTSLFAAVQASHGLGANTADALFFLRFGVDSLPLMIFLAGPAVMVFVLAHGAGLAKAGTARWLRIATMTGVGWTLFEWSLAILGGRLAYPVIWISTQVIIMVTYTMMWNAAGASCTTRQAKRLFPIFATAGIAGGVVGNLLTGPLAVLLGTQNLLLVQGSLLLGAALILQRSTSLFADDRAEGEARPISELGRLFSSVLGNRFTRIAAAIAVALAALFYFVYFPFSEAVADASVSEADVAGFLGIFSSVATGATFVVSLLVTNRLFARLGLVVSLMLVPAVYAAGFALWLGGFSLVTATLVRGLQWVTVNAVGGTAFSALFNVMTGRRRSQIVAFMTAIPTQVGTATAGLLLLVAGSAPPQMIFGIGLAVAALCLALVIRLRSEYLDAVVSAVRRGVVGVLDTPAQSLFTPDDADARRIVESALADPRPQARAMAATGLARLGDPAAADLVEILLTDPDPKVRAAAFGSVCALAPGRIANYARAGLEDGSSEVRLQVVRYLGGIDPQEAGGAELAVPALDDPDPSVQAAAATAVGGSRGVHVLEEMLASEQATVVVAALSEIANRAQQPPAVDVAGFLDHPESAVRRWAVSVHIRIGGDPDLLKPGLEDRSPRVRQAAADALARTDSGHQTLLEVLATGSVVASEAALQALTPMEELSPEFVAWAVAEAKRAAYLEWAADALEPAAESPASDYLVRVLRMRVERLVTWVLLAMTIERTESMMRTVARGIRSPDQETRSQAIEAVEALGAREVSSVLLPLLEKGDRGTAPDREEVIGELAEDFDPWISTLARRIRDRSPGEDPTVPGWSSMTPDESPETLGPMERVLALQRVRMFSQLDPEDLERVAAATREIRYEAREVIFAEGQRGDEMLLIVGGEVEVTTASAGTRRHIETYGPGEPVGELALLTGGLRSADVHAGGEGAHGLLLSGSDLASVLADRPEVALRMLATLAERLARQTPAPRPGSLSQ